MTARYREELPMLGGETFLTDGGVETFLIFHRGIELPEFAAFTLLEDVAGREELREYYRPYLDLAERYGTGFVLESPTWRANQRWAEAVGYDADRVAQANSAAIGLLEELREAAPRGVGPVAISGCIGPHDDGYAPGATLSASEAQTYHSAQIVTLAGTAADLVTAVTMTYVEEALGIARAATAAGMPVVISFTVETDGRLPSGQPLAEAVAQVDADPESEVAYFMVNCAHPTHFDAVLDGGEAWVERVRGLRANASRLSHAELDEAETLDEGDPADLGARYAALCGRLPQVNVLGGCCGTDHRHVDSIAAAVLDGTAPKARA